MTCTPWGRVETCGAHLPRLRAVRAYRNCPPCPADSTRLHWRAVLPSPTGPCSSARRHTAVSFFCTRAECPSAIPFRASILARSTVPHDLFPFFLPPCLPHDLFSFRPPSSFIDHPLSPPSFSPTLLLLISLRPPFPPPTLPALARTHMLPSSIFGGGGTVSAGSAGPVPFPFRLAVALTGDFETTAPP
jgi:hypothetical protein